jgi:hypothetical protein
MAKRRNAIEENYCKMMTKCIEDLKVRYMCKTLSSITKHMRTKIAAQGRRW